MVVRLLREAFGTGRGFESNHGEARNVRGCFVALKAEKETLGALRAIRRLLEAANAPETWYHLIKTA